MDKMSNVMPACDVAENFASTRFSDMSFYAVQRGLGFLEGHARVLRELDGKNAFADFLFHQTYLALLIRQSQYIEAGLIEFL